jgi:hypothetical protein
MNDFRERRVAANPFDNPAFRKELSIALQDALRPLTETQEKHTETLELHDARLDAHDGKFNRQTGGFAVLMAMGGFVDWLLHWKSGSGH